MEPLMMLVAYLLFLTGLVYSVVWAWQAMHTHKPDDPDNRVANLTSKYSTNNNRFKAWQEAEASTARSENITALSHEISKQDDFELAQINAAIQKIRATTARDIAALQAPAEVAISGIDMERRLTHAEHRKIEDDLAHRLSIEANRQTFTLTEAATALGLDNMSYVEIQKKGLMDNLELKRQREETDNKLRGVFIYEEAEYQKLYLHLDYINGLYEKVKTLEGRARELTEKHIAFMEASFSERQRLLQNTSRENVGSSDEDTDYTRND